MQLTINEALGSSGQKTGLAESDLAHQTSRLGKRAVEPPLGHGRSAHFLLTRSHCFSDLCSSLQRDRVHAISQSAGRRAIGENMPEVSIAGVAKSLDPLQEGRSVKPVRNDARRDRLGERRPSGAGLEFLPRLE